MTELPHFENLGAAKVRQHDTQAAAPHLPIKGVRVRRGAAESQVRGAAGAVPRSCHGEDFAVVTPANDPACKLKFLTRPTSEETGNDYQSSKRRQPADVAINKALNKLEEGREDHDLGNVVVGYTFSIKIQHHGRQVPGMRQRGGSNSYKVL
jgi:hypothetical protein